MDKLKVLRGCKFGAAAAEQEQAALASYFVETEAWRQISSGEVDIIYGPKGFGKSAIYSLLVSRKSEFASLGISVFPAENPGGTTVFSDPVVSAIGEEEQFNHLWKLYFLTLIGEFIRERRISSEPAKRVIKVLTDQKLLPREFSLETVLQSVFDYVHRLPKTGSIEAGYTVDPHTGMAGFMGKITFREPTAQQQERGLVSVDRLLRLANAAMKGESITLWLILDRLDAAFAQSAELEKRALRSLFRVYVDLAGLESIRLKIFLRTDIWETISDGGFREATHTTRNIYLAWDRTALMNLLVSRMVHNPSLCSAYGVSATSVLGDVEQQEQLFYRVFLDKVDAGKKKPRTFDWMLLRTCDASHKPAPRELIRLLVSAQSIQRSKYDRGEPEPPGEALFDGASLKEALRTVSKERLELTLFAEFPTLKSWILKLSNGKAEHTTQTLAAVWKADDDQATQIANQLVRAGFFEKHESKDGTTYKVPFLYRDALGLTQGHAEQDSER